MKALPRFLGIVMLLVLVGGRFAFGFGQTRNPDAAKVVQQVMTEALSRCYSEVDGVEKISVEPPTDQETKRIKALGRDAIAPLSAYLELNPKGGIRQFFAVRFLEAIGGSSAFPPLTRAFAQDQWEVTRAAALSAMFKNSESKAKPYVEAGLRDKSDVVRKLSQELWSLYPAANATPPVRIVISTAKATYAPGVPIVLTITMKNVSTVPLKVIRADINGKQAELDYNFDVKDSSGRLVERSRYGQDVANKRIIESVQSPTLEPGSTLSETSIITKLYHLSVPGKYTVTAKRKFYYSTGAHQYKSAVAHSNKITFSIAP